MKLFKNLTAVMLILCMIASVLSACNTGSPSDKTDGTAKSEASDTANGDTTENPPSDTSSSDTANDNEPQNVKLSENELKSMQNRLV